jgi:hypothetical protein
MNGSFRFLFATFMVVWTPAIGAQPASESAGEKTRDAWRACAARLYRELRATIPNPTLRAENALSACATEDGCSELHWA